MVTSEEKRFGRAVLVLGAIATTGQLWLAGGRRALVPRRGLATDSPARSSEAPLAAEDKCRGEAWLGQAGRPRDETHSDRFMVTARLDPRTLMLLLEVRTRTCRCVSETGRRKVDDTSVSAWAHAPDSLGGRVVDQAPNVLTAAGTLLTQRGCRRHHAVLPRRSGDGTRATAGPRHTGETRTAATATVQCSSGPCK